MDLYSQSQHVSDWCLFRLFSILLTDSLCRYVASDLTSDITVNVGDVKFYLHKVQCLSSTQGSPNFKPCLEILSPGLEEKK